MPETPALAQAAERVVRCKAVLDAINLVINPDDPQHHQYTDAIMGQLREALAEWLEETQRGQHH